MNPEIKPRSIEGLLVFMLSHTEPIDAWLLFDHDLLWPIFWLQERFPGGSALHMHCPAPALKAFARRHPDVVYGCAAWSSPLPMATQLAAYLDSLAAEMAIATVITARKISTTASASGGRL